MLAYFLDIYNGLGIFVFILIITGIYLGAMNLINNAINAGAVCFLVSIICALLMVFVPSKEFLSQFL